MKAILNKEYGYLAVVKREDGEFLIGGCRKFTPEEAIEHWSKGSQSGGNEFSQNAIELAREVLKGDYKYPSFKEIQDLTVKSGNASYIYVAALFTVGMDIEALQKGILQTDDIRLISQFMEEIKGVDKTALQARIDELIIPSEEFLETNPSAKMMYDYVDLGKVEPSKLLSKALAETGNALYIFMSAAYINGMDIKILQEGIIKTEDIEYIRRFMSQVKGSYRKTLRARIDELIIPTKEFLETNPSARMIHRYIEIGKVKPCKLLSKALAETGDAFYIGMSIHTKGMDIKILQKGILQTDNTYYIRAFMRDAEGADKEKLQARLDQLENEKAQ